MTQPEEYLAVVTFTDDGVIIRPVGATASQPKAKQEKNMTPETRERLKKMNHFGLMEDLKKKYKLQ